MIWNVCYKCDVSCSGNVGCFVNGIQIMAPIVYHIELFSDHYFILTNEDSVFVHMNEVSAVSIYGLQLHVPVFMGYRNMYLVCMCVLVCMHMCMYENLCVYLCVHVRMHAWVCLCLCCMFSATHHLQGSKLMLAHGSGIVSNLLEMVTTCDSTTEHNPSIKDQVNKLPKVNLEDNHIRYHLYKAVCIRVSVFVHVCVYACMRAYVCVCMRACVRACMCTCICRDVFFLSCTSVVSKSTVCALYNNSYNSLMLCCLPGEHSCT